MPETAFIKFRNDRGDIILYKIVNSSIGSEREERPLRFSAGWVLRRRMRECVRQTGKPRGDKQKKEKKQR